MFAEHWWWGQAEFVAFAGGRVHGVAPTAVAVWTPDEVVTLAPPFARTVARAGGGEWAVRASNWRWRVELEGEATDPLLLPGADPARAAARGALPPSPARAACEVVVRRGRRVWFRGRVGDGRAGGRRYARMTSRAMSSSPPLLAVQRAQHVVGHRVRREVDAGERPRSRSIPTSIACVRSSIRPSV